MSNQTFTKEELFKRVGLKNWGSTYVGESDVVITEDNGMCNMEILLKDDSDDIVGEISFNVPLEEVAFDF